MTDALMTATKPAADFNRPTEHALLAQCRAGEAAALDRLVACYQRRIAGLAYRLLGWPSDVDDVVQDVLVTMIDKLPTFRGDAALSTWVYRITVSCCRRQRRWAWLRRRAVADVPASAAPSSPAADASEKRACVRAAVQQLRPVHREVIVLHYLEGLSTVETAAVLGISRGAVDVRLHRARTALRAHLPAALQEKL
jgi:RNA polymerase sigma-70 factor (ECF subfamily)